MMTYKDLISQWNELHFKYVLENPETRNERMAEWCEQTILKAKLAYYETEIPIIDDQAYDRIEDWLRILKPESVVLQKVGS